MFSSAVKTVRWLPYVTEIDAIYLRGTKTMSRQLLKNHKKRAYKISVDSYSHKNSIWSSHWVRVCVSTRQKQRYFLIHSHHFNSNYLQLARLLCSPTDCATHPNDVCKRRYFDRKYINMRECKRVLNVILFVVNAHVAFDLS